MKRFLILACLAIVAAGCTKKNGGESHEWVRDAVVYEMNVRQMTPEGTFDAAAEHLPRLKSLGVDIVWLMPVYQIGEKERKGTLGSYYAIKDYKTVNPEFGDLASFDAFVDKAHKLGLKVVLDWVANHTSPDAAWVSGKPAEWYYRDSLGNTMVEYDWTDIAKLNYDCAGVRDAEKDCMRFWLDRGIDGFRCDMAYIVPQDFWSDAIACMRADYGELYFLAEGEETWLHEAGFDASYSWKLHHLLNDVAQGRAGRQELVDYIAWNSENYPADALRLTFTSNHDENSWSGSELERMGDAWYAMSVLCFTLPQSQPLIYTAQETGYNHRLEFFEKDPVPAQRWDDPELKAAFADRYKALIDLYHGHEALREGSFELLDSADDVLAFRRATASDTLTVKVQLVAPWDCTIE